MPKSNKFLSQHSASISDQNISIDCDSNNVVTAVLVDKPTEADATIIAVADTSVADHVNLDDEIGGFEEITGLLMTWETSRTKY